MLMKVYVNKFYCVYKSFYWNCYKMHLQRAFIYVSEYMYFAQKKFFRNSSNDQLKKKDNDSSVLIVYIQATVGSTLDGFLGNTF